MRDRAIRLGVLGVIAAVGAALVAFSIPEKGNPTELGLVKWGRDLDAALAESADSGKPVLVLFQEIPG